MPSLLDKLGPIRYREPTLEQYRDEGQDTSSLPWLSIARQSLAITAADKVCLCPTNHRLIKLMERYRSS